MMQRTPQGRQPSRRAMDAAAQTQAKRVHFAPLDGDVADVTILEPTQNDPLLTPLADASDPDVPRVPDMYNYKERLPQSFPHGLPPSSLEAGATDQQYPPTYLFPDPPLGDDPELLWTPLRRPHDSTLLHFNSNSDSKHNSYSNAQNTFTYSYSYT